MRSLIAALFAFATWPALAQPQQDIFNLFTATTVDIASMAGTAIPPPVNATGAVGTAVQYARADHTHVSSIVKTTVLTNASCQVTMAYPAGFFTAAPVVQLTVEVASGQPYVALITSNSATTLNVQVRRAQTLPQNLVNALLSGVFDLFGGSCGAGVPVHIYAAKATQ